MTNHHEVRDLGALADFVGDQAHIQDGGITNVLLFAARREIVENDLATLFEDFAHLAGKIQIRFEPQGTGDIVKESSLDRNGVDDVLSEERAIELFGDPNGIIERRLGMFRAVEGNKDVFNHASLLMSGSRETA